MKTTLILLAAAATAISITSCTAYIDPNGPAAPSTVTSTQTTADPYIGGTVTTTERTTTY